MHDPHDSPFGAPVDEHERRMALLTAYALEQLELADRVEAERLLADDADGSLASHVAETKRLGELLRAGSPTPAGGSSLRKEVLARLDDPSVVVPPIVKSSKDQEPSPEKIAMSHGAKGRGFARWGYAIAGLAAMALIGVGVAAHWGRWLETVSLDVAKQTDSRPMAPGSAGSLPDGWTAYPAKQSSSSRIASRPFERVGGTPFGDTAESSSRDGASATRAMARAEAERISAEIEKMGDASSIPTGHVYERRSQEKGDGEAGESLATHDKRILDDASGDEAAYPDASGPKAGNELLKAQLHRLKQEISGEQAARAAASGDGDAGNSKGSGQTLPSPYYLTDDAQYAPTPGLSLNREAEALRQSRAERKAAATSEARRAKLASGASEDAGGQSLMMQVTPSIVMQEEAEENLRLVPRSTDRTHRKANGFTDVDEQYDAIVENPFHPAKDSPLSTFAIDVDTASYANVRRFLNNNQLPPPSAVRLEEMLNYFSYAYPQPEGPHPFSVNLEAAECPWTAGHRLVRVALKGKEVHKAERPSSNLVFLIDTSGSMQEEDKLPLLKSALTLLTRELGANDRVSIVTYAGDAGLKLAPTSGSEKEKIVSVLDGLLSGGSTHGSAGIVLAYEQAKQSFIQGGTNRVILCTDGDLNVGITSDDDLVKLITEKAQSGVYLTVLGFGTGNLKDSKMEKLADHGNGVYAYLDGLKEARKVLVEQMSGSLVTIAKDVKIQVEFNPAQVAAYRLLGYENRVMANQDFRNDKKDAGEIGAGHTVTALYEIVPVGVDIKPAGDAPKLKYQMLAAPPATAETSDDISKELLTVRLRYKSPEAKLEDAATEFETALSKPGEALRAASEDFRFATAVAMAGLTLRQSEHRGTANLDAAGEIAQGALGEDPSGWRKEFVELLQKARSLGR